MCFGNAKRLVIFTIVTFNGSLQDVSCANNRFAGVLWFNSALRGCSLLQLCVKCEKNWKISISNFFEILKLGGDVIIQR